MKKRMFIVSAFLVLAMFLLVSCKQVKIKTAQIVGTPKMELKHDEEMELKIKVTDGAKKFKNKEFVFNLDKEGELGGSGFDELRLLKVNIKQEGFDTTTPGKKTCKLMLDKAKIEFDIVVAPIELHETGTGTAQDPYKLSHPDHFEQMETLLNSEGENNQETERYFKLQQDINFTGYKFKRVDITSTVLKTFEFDGNGKSLIGIKLENEVQQAKDQLDKEHELSNTRMDNPDTDPDSDDSWYSAAMFTDMRINTAPNDAHFTFKNLTVKDSMFAGLSNASAIFGYLYRKTNVTFENITVDNVTLVATRRVGALIGSCYCGQAEILAQNCTVKNSKFSAVYNNKMVDDNGRMGDDGDKVGGLFGQQGSNNHITVENPTIGVTIMGARNAGLIAGMAVNLTLKGNMKILDGTSIKSASDKDLFASGNVPVGSDAGVIAGRTNGRRKIENVLQPLQTLEQADQIHFDPSSPFKIKTERGEIIEYNAENGEILSPVPSTTLVIEGDPLLSTRWTENDTEDTFRFVGCQHGSEGAETPARVAAPSN